MSAVLPQYHITARFSEKHPEITNCGTLDGAPVVACPAKSNGAVKNPPER